MIHVSSENISSNLIIESEEYFKCKVINYYGQVEQGVSGVNLNDNYSISLLPFTNFYRLENKTIAALNLLNWSNPLVNYQIQDELEEKGKNKFNIIGRNNIYLKNTDGFNVSTVNFYTFLQQFKALVKWQIVQKRDLNIDFNFEGILSNDERLLIENGLKIRLGKILINFRCNHFKYNGEGKINPIVVDK